MATSKVIIVTGANRGIGLAICQGLLSRPDIGPLTLLAASRKGEDLALEPASSGGEVLYPRLDIADGESVRNFAREVESEHGRVDVLINNAGINVDGEHGLEEREKARRTLDVNWRGTGRMCTSLLPSLRKSTSGGRIVNLSSIASRLQLYSPAIQARFRDPKLTLDGLEALATEYEESVANSSAQQAGFPGPGHNYNVSKACVNALTRILARENPDLTVNACCPGWIATDMGRLVGNRPPKTPEQGARVPLHLALDDLDGVSGQYWANDSIRGKEEGKVQDW